jgi:hypothetical protein
VRRISSRPKSVAYWFVMLRRSATVCVPVAMFGPPF